MKKIVSVLLTVAMLLSACALCFTGCAKEETSEEVIGGIQEGQNNAASTLVMWVVTEDGTDDKQAQEVAKQMATITKSKYKTNLIIRYLTMDEYYTELEKAILENERLLQIKTLAETVAKATKKANTDVTGAFKNGNITEDEKAGRFFTFLSDAIKEVNAVVTGTHYDEEFKGVSFYEDEETDELEEFLIEIVGQLVGYDIADQMLEQRDTLIAVMQNELANPPAPEETKKGYIAMTQEAIDMMERLFDLTEEHKEEFEEAEDEEEKEEEEEEEDDEDTIIRDENGNMIVDTTIYPEVEDHQVDIVYISGYDKYTEYIENEWLLGLDAEIKTIKSYVSTSLLNAVKQENVTYAIPNNNIIGEYTYMLIDKTLFDKYYYTGQVKDVHGVSDVADFIEDIAKYEPDVLPINGDVDYCMSLLAHYWSINPENLAIDPGKFSVLGYAYGPDDVVTRGSVALKFDNLLANENYIESLTNLKEFEFAGYFGTPEEGQKSAISFVTGDASLVEDYEKDNYVVVVDYPKAADEDIYENMFGVCAYTSDLKKSMQIITLMNTDVEFRNLFQYGIEGVNYTLDNNGVAHKTSANAYNMDIAKTGNQFIAYVPEGMNVEVWEYAKQQNRESQVNPLLGFDFNNELTSDEEDFLSEEAKTAKDVFYYVETMDTELLKHVNELSAKAWEEIQACTDIDTLEDTINKWYKEVAKDQQIMSAMNFKMIEPKLDSETGLPLEKAPDDYSVDNVVYTVTQTKTRVTEEVRELEDGTTEIIEMTSKYFLVTKTFNPYQVYFRWMKANNYLTPELAALDTPAQ